MNKIKFHGSLSTPHDRLNTPRDTLNTPHDRLNTTRDRLNTTRDKLFTVKTCHIYTVIKKVTLTSILLWATSNSTSLSFTRLTQSSS